MIPRTLHLPRRSARHLFAHVGFLIVLFGAFVLTGCRSTPQATTAAKSETGPALSDQGVHLATNILVDELTYSAAGIGKSALTQEQALRLAKIDLVVDARTFEADYEANELAGDAKYKNKRFLISGTIHSIEKDFTNQGYLVLASGSLLGVQAHLSDRGMVGAASLKKGMKTFLVCQSSDRVVGTETAGDCQRLSQYLDEIKPELATTTRDFLTGRRTMPRELGTALAYSYILDAQLPASSACRAQLNDGCREELKTITSDKARVAQIKQEEQKMEPNLKFE